MLAQHIRMQQWIVICAWCYTVLLGSCTGVPRPTGALSQAELAVRDAERSQAPQYAALELQLAKKNLDQAKQAIQRNDYEAARRTAEKALVEAQLAEDKAQAASTREAVDELRQSIESLRDEISRGSKSR